MAEKKDDRDKRDESTALEPVMMGTIEAQTRGEIDIQIATAKQYPRDVAQFLKKAESLACLNDDIAAACFYKLKRRGRDGDKVIEGPSVRFAEIIAATWTNMRIDARTVNEDDKFVYSQGTAWDLQENVAIRFETRRRITDSNGRKYSDDMVGVTANAATAIALRNAVFRVIPKAFWENVYDSAKQCAIGNVKTLGERRQKMLEYYTQKLGVAADRVFKYLEITGIESMTLEHVEDLRGLATAIKEGDTTIEKEFFAANELKGAKPTDNLGKLTESMKNETKAEPKQETKQEPPKQEASTTATPSSGRLF